MTARLIWRNMRHVSGVLRFTDIQEGSAAMLTWEDCLGVAGCTEELVDAIAEHEHVPEIVALELANYMVHDPNGAPRLKRIILDDIATAQARGDIPHVNHLRHVLAHFVAGCRNARPGA